MTAVSQENPYLVNPRWQTAEQVAEVVRRRYPADVLAVAAHGPLAHGDDTADIDVLVVTYRDNAGPRSVSRRVDGALVAVTAAGADTYLARARTLTPSWPLLADRYLTTKPLHDPTGWLATLRDAHLTRLAEARPPEFSTLARQAWCTGFSAHQQAIRLAEWYETDPALLLLGAARLAAATVSGLLSRTYFRSPGDAVRRTGVAGADMTELGDVLRGQAEELAARGRPVDGAVPDLFGR